MTTRMPEFEPTAVLEGGTSPLTGQRFPSRRSTSDEQRIEAIAHAARWMAEHRIWTVELPVRWSRADPTVLTVAGHAEHLNGQVVPAIDRVREADAEGRAIALTVGERHARLEAELAEVFEGGL